MSLRLNSGCSSSNPVNAVNFFQNSGLGTVTAFRTSGASFSTRSNFPAPKCNVSGSWPLTVMIVHRRFGHLQRLDPQAPAVSLRHKRERGGAFRAHGQGNFRSRGKRQRTAVPLSSRAERDDLPRRPGQVHEIAQPLGWEMARVGLESAGWSPSCS